MRKNYSIFQLPIVVSVIFLNIARRPHIRRLLNVTIPYDTSPEKITRAREIQREILAVPAAPALETTEGTEALAHSEATRGAEERQNCGYHQMVVYYRRATALILAR